jgi:hypothetical protein
MFYLFFKPPLPSEKLFSHIHIFSFSNYKLRLSPAGFLYLVFLLTIILSMLTEDTIETQAGVTFFAFFNSFLFFSSSDK